MNSEYIKQALVKVGNPNVLVNLISRRVRQLTCGGGNGRPLIEQAPGMGDRRHGAAGNDRGKNGVRSLPATEEEAQPAPKKRRGR